MKSAFGWEYENTWRAHPYMLWGLSCLVWAAGVVFETYLVGAIAASGGIAIAVTTPLFASAFAKQSTYELDIKLAQIGLLRDINFGLKVSEVSNPDGKSAVDEEVAQNRKSLEEFNIQMKEQRRFSRALLVSQSWIVGISTAIWALGAWLGNYFFHCGRLTC